MSFALIDDSFQFVTLTKLNYHSKSGETYLIDIKKQTCTCKWATIHSKTIMEGKTKKCRHLAQVLDSLYAKQILIAIQNIKKTR